MALAGRLSDCSTASTRRPWSCPPDFPGRGELHRGAPAKRRANDARFHVLARPAQGMPTISASARCRGDLAGTRRRPSRETCETARTTDSTASATQRGQCGKIMPSALRVRAGSVGIGAILHAPSRTPGRSFGEPATAGAPAEADRDAIGTGSDRSGNGRLAVELGALSQATAGREASSSAKQWKRARDRCRRGRGYRLKKRRCDRSIGTRES